ncbi:MAG: ArgE/DapE family deacylase [Armatimonadetes bacterium]|nr:ArgE/DapE family deacylase [Armatimonadota bacterium]
MDADLLNTLHRLSADAEEELVARLSRLVQVPSPNPPGEYEPIADAVREMLRDLGYQVEFVDAPEAEVRQAGLRAPRRNVIGGLGGTGDPARTIILNAHIDTVPVVSPERWTYPPFSGAVADGRVWGRGAVDSKARMVSYAMAPILLRRAGVSPAGTVLCAFTCDEETGGDLGAGYLVRSGRLRGDAAVVEGYNSPIIRAAAGLLRTDIHIEGKAAHASRPDLGVNAIEPLGTLIPPLLALRDELTERRSEIAGMGHTTLSLGVVSGGVKVNVVPDRCTLSIDCRVIPEVDPQQVVGRIRAIAAAAEARHPGIHVHVAVVRTAAPTRLAEDHPVVQGLARACRQVLGRPVPIEGETGGTDARWFNAGGIPAANYGPGRMESGNYHGVDEHVEIADLVEATDVLAVFLAEFVSGGADGAAPAER